MHRKRLSVVVPLYNVAQYVHMPASSIALQAFDGLEVVLVDDGSTDYSLERFMEYLVDIETVCIRQENAGPGGARNTGILAATGEYIMFLDGDDFLLPNALENILELLDSESPDVLFGRYHLWSDKKGLTYTKRVATQPPSCNKSRTEYILGGQPEAAWCPIRYICRRDFLTSHKIFFETDVLCEDVKWATNLLMAVEYNDGEISFLKEPFYAYNHRRPGSTMNTYSVKRLLDLNNVLVDMLETYEERPSLCRVLVWESFYYINEYCLFSKDDRKKILECYRNVLPYYRRSGFFPHRVAGRLRNAVMFYLMSVGLFAVKMARRVWIHMRWVLNGMPHVDIPAYGGAILGALRPEQLYVEEVVGVR